MTKQSLSVMLQFECLAVKSFINQGDGWLAESQNLKVKK